MHIDNNTAQNRVLEIYDIAAQLWKKDKQELVEELRGIKIIKQTTGKMMGIFPPFSDFPSVFFKIYYYERGFHSEVNGLSATQTMTQIHGVNTPAVIKVIPEKMTVLTESRNWQNTSSALRRLFINLSEYDWKKLGEWLRAFHDSKPSTEANTYFLRKKFEKVTSLKNTSSHLFSREELEQMDEIIRAAKTHFEKFPCEWVISHGDFGLDNVKVGSSGMDIIDFEDCQMAPREFDILNFLTRLDYTARFPHRPKTFDHISSEFLSGYGPYETCKLVHDFLYLLIKLDMTESYSRRRSVTSLPLWNRLIYRYFERQNLRILKIFLGEQGINILHD